MQLSISQNLLKGNCLLAALPADDYKEIQSDLVITHLPVGKIFYNCGDSISHVYFPLNTVSHLVTTMESGETSEVGIVGFEGIIGISALMGAATMPNQAFVINASYALKIKAEIIKKLFDKCGILNKLILRYMNTFYIQVSQIAACSRIHSLEERLCRWLLMVQDRIEGNELKITQDFISQMLATRRPYITTALGNLQKTGAVCISRRNIKILNRKILEKFACECYGIINKEFKNLKQLYKSAKSLKSEN